MYQLNLTVDLKNLLTAQRQRNLILQGNYNNKLPGLRRFETRHIFLVPLFCLFSRAAYH